jgi:hypothetical protein
MTCGRYSGVKPPNSFIGAAPNMTRRGYRYWRTVRDTLKSIGATNGEQLVREICTADTPCLDALLTGVLPDAYSSNSSADTGGYAYISPAQVRAVLQAQR